MCAAYTDGTKLNIEMALVANATGLVPTRCGMLGPRAKHVSEVFAKFDFAGLRNPGVVDYKIGDGPFYLAYRPYHLCHMETPLALVEVALRRSPILVSRPQPVAEVATFAKTNLAPGDSIDVGIGSSQVYGMIDGAATLRKKRAVPICLLDREDRENGPVARILRPVPKDQLVTWDDIELSTTPLLEAYRRQVQMLDPATAP